MSTTDSSLQRWLIRLESGDNLAAERLWKIYFERMVRLAHNRLSAHYRKATDAEDIALNAFDSFCRGVENKRFPLLSDHDGLWRLLVSITIHKALKVVRDQNRIKRGGQFRELKGLDSSSDSLIALNQVLCREPSPEFVAELTEQYELLVKTLDDPKLTQIVNWKMEGWTNDEIADKLQRTTRTIERKLQLIRKIWVQQFSES